MCAMSQCLVVVVRSSQYIGSNSLSLDLSEAVLGCQPHTALQQLVNWAGGVQVWPQKHQVVGAAVGPQSQRGPHTPPDMEVTTVQITYENMQFLTREAVAVARQHHVDSCLQARTSLFSVRWDHRPCTLHICGMTRHVVAGLSMMPAVKHLQMKLLPQVACFVRFCVSSCFVVQALFVLGDMALVTYDLPEAQRILSIVALTAADGQVRACMEVYEQYRAHICIMMWP